MQKKTRFIDYIMSHDPALYSSLIQAEREGLIFLSEDEVGIEPTDNLQLSYPHVHEHLKDALVRWSEGK